MARRRRYYDDSYSYGYFPPSKPRAAKGGIKAQSKRGDFGETWWGKRWIEVLESFRIGARLTRGRSYARSGQVTSIDIDKGVVNAKVQGSRSTPYRVTIRLKAFSSAEWDRLAGRLSEQALFAARLLAGEMPAEIEPVFREAKLSLFPEKLGDLKTDCSCPDWSNPCKHIAAVYYLLGEEFDRDPFLLFKLRGLTREELVARLRVDEADVDTRKETAATGTKRRRGKRSAVAEPVAEAPVLAPEPLPADADPFWNGGDVPAGLFGEVRPPQVAAALPQRLGGFPFWRGQQRFLTALEPLYAAASSAGLEVLLGSAQSETLSKTA